MTSDLPPRARPGTSVRAYARATEESRFRQGEPPGREMTVFVVDADEDSRLRWRLALPSSTGATVIGEAGGVADAVRLMQDTHPDLIVLDPIIPEWDSRMVVRALKLWAPASVLLVATVPTVPQSGANLLAAGADFHFDKYLEFHGAMDAVATLSLRLTALPLPEPERAAVSSDIPLTVSAAS